MTHILNFIDIKFCKATFKLSLVFFLTSLIFQVYISNKVAVESVDMLKVSSEKASITLRIEKLKQETSQFSSLFYIEKRAESLGLVSYVGSLKSIGPVTVASLVDVKKNSQ